MKKVINKSRGHFKITYKLTTREKLIIDYMKDNDFINVENFLSEENNKCFELDNLLSLGFIEVVIKKNIKCFVLGKLGRII